MTAARVACDDGEMHTLQETFDLSGLALVAQGGPSSTEYGFCRYLNDAGRRCAAGHLFPPDTVIADLEGCTVNQSCDGEKSIALRAALADHDLRLVRALQQAHDEATEDVAEEDEAVEDGEWRGRWLRRVLVVASMHGLSADRVVEAARAAGWRVD